MVEAGGGTTSEAEEEVLQEEDEAEVLQMSGRHILRDCVEEKRMLPCVGCVDVLEVRIDLV